jgi:hypothetical protein
LLLVHGIEHGVSEKMVNMNENMRAHTPIMQAATGGHTDVVRKVICFKEEYDLSRFLLEY